MSDVPIYRVGPQPGRTPYVPDMPNNRERNPFESVLMRWMNLEPVIQSEVSQKEKNKIIYQCVYMESRRMVLTNLFEEQTQT